MLLNCDRAHHHKRHPRSELLERRPVRLILYHRALNHQSLLLRFHSSPTEQQLLEHRGMSRRIELKVCVHTLGPFHRDLHAAGVCVCVAWAWRRAAAVHTPAPSRPSTAAGRRRWRRYSCSYSLYYCTSYMYSAELYGTALLYKMGGRGPMWA